MRCDIAILRCQFGTVNCDIGTKRCDIAILRCQLGSVRCDIGTVRCDIAILRCQFGTVRCYSGTQRYHSWVKSCYSPSPKAFGRNFQISKLINYQLCLFQHAYFEHLFGFACNFKTVVGAKAQNPDDFVVGSKH